MDKFDQIATGIYSIEVTPEMKEAMAEGPIEIVDSETEKKFKAANKDQFLGEIKEKIYEKFGTDKFINEVEDAMIDVKNGSLLKDTEYIVVS